MSKSKSNTLNAKNNTEVDTNENDSSKPDVIDHSTDKAIEMYKKIYEKEINRKHLNNKSINLINIDFEYNYKFNYKTHNISL